MGLNISWLAVVVAIVVGIAIAGVTYSDKGPVGPTWRRLTGVTQADSAKAGKRPFAVLAAAITVTALALALGYSMAAAFSNVHSVWLALAVGLIAWLGFSFSTLAQHNAFEQKPAQLTAINSAYQLALFLGMSLPIGLLH